MKIYVISDTKNLERSENIKTQFASQEGNWQYEIVEAVMNPNQPSVGILRSWKKVVELAKKEDHSEILVLEDDFLPLTSSAIKDIINTWNSHFLQDSLLLGSIYEGSVIKSIEDDEYLPFSWVYGKIAGLSAVIIPRNLYKTVLRAEEGYHLDYTLSITTPVPICVMDPFSIIQGNFTSANSNNMQELNNNLHLKYKLAGR